MAHQQLKFQFNPKKDIWQPVLGAQAHGTFFMAYMKIIDFDQHNQNSDGKYEYTCHFKLQNFRGAITHGLNDIISETNIISEEGVVDENENNKELVEIVMQVKPFFKQDELHNIVLKFDKKIEKEMLATINLELLAPDRSLFDPNNLDNSLYINPYTHFRDGDEYQEVSRRPAGSKSAFPNPSNAAGIGGGFCLADIFWFWW